MRSSQRQLRTCKSKWGLSGTFIRGGNAVCWIGGHESDPCLLSLFHDGFREELNPSYRSAKTFPPVQNNILTGPVKHGVLSK